MSETFGAAEDSKSKLGCLLATPEMETKTRPQQADLTQNAYATPLVERQPIPDWIDVKHVDSENAPRCPFKQNPFHSRTNPLKKPRCARDIFGNTMAPSLFPSPSSKDEASSSEQKDKYISRSFLFETPLRVNSSRKCSNWSFLLVSPLRANSSRKCSNWTDACAASADGNFLQPTKKRKLRQYEAEFLAQSSNHAAR
eukprot:g9298.t1